MDDDFFHQVHSSMRPDIEGALSTKNAFPANDRRAARRFSSQQQQQKVKVATKSVSSWKKTSTCHSQKRYILLFTCFVTRAIYIENTEEPNTDEPILAIGS